ncbi:ester cyclase [Rhodocytophaga rosea]|uniref:Ester cyclase n=1 Tax=Rhodocytophaga rosea TaxID=2704465 RepID=A0A6C0GTY1_9BACT|nr:ester cyclase [Rhodocytophaga rosea]QHT71496.1 ester cyclase [Rhodocytophaga rosea]
MKTVLSLLPAIIAISTMAFLYTPSNVLCYISNSQPKLTDEAKEQRNKATALASVRAVAANQIDEALKDCAPDIINYGNGSIPPAHGLEKNRAGLKMATTAVPFNGSENLMAVADGEWVMVWGKFSGSWQKDMMGQKATGKPYQKTDVEIFRFNEAGQITEHHSVQSFYEVARQIGLQLPN